MSSRLTADVSVREHERWLSQHYGFALGNSNEEYTEAVKITNEPGGGSRQN